MRHFHFRTTTVAPTARIEFHVALRCFLERQEGRLTQAVSSAALEEVINAKLDLHQLALILSTRFVLYRQAFASMPQRDPQGWQLLVEVQERFIGGMGNDGEHFAILEVYPSMPLRDGSIHMPSQDLIRQARNRKAKQYHPDKQLRQGGDQKRFLARVQPKDAEEMAKKVNAAHEWLQSEANLGGFSARIQALFGEKLRPMLSKFRESVKKLLEEQRYEQVSVLLQDIGQVDQRLASRMGISIQNFERLVQDDLLREVSKTKKDVEEKWNRGLFRELHEDFSKLKQMGRDLAGCPNVVLDDSIDRITTKVNEMIEEEGMKARVCVGRCETWSEAASCVWQFGEHLVKLGRILTHLRDFKSGAESQVHYALSSCYDKRQWGIDFIFELGMKLGKGAIGDPQSDDPTIAKVLLSSFPHFEAVRTVMFNRETAHKDVAETLQATRVTFHAFGSGPEGLCGLTHYLIYV